MKTLEKNLNKIKERIKIASEKSGRSEKDIKLVAVTKTVDESIINYSIELGISNIAENRAQEIVRKYPNINEKAKLHMIGHMQRNKVRQIIDKVDLIHSLDSIRLANEIEKRASMIDKTIDVLIQINIGEEEQKTGLKVEELHNLIEHTSKCEHIKIIGLMAIMPYIEEAEKVRPYFAQMKKLFDEIREMNIPNVVMKELSMGMSHDFDIAIEEGATMVRIGSAIYK